MIGSIPMSATSPIISVVIPVYNKATFLAESIQSVCMQTMLDIEIILINDGSTDASSEVIRLAKERWSQIPIFIIEKHNKILRVC